MTGWIVAVIFFVLFLLADYNLHKWYTKYKELMKASLRDQRELKFKIDQLQMGGNK